MTDFKLEDDAVVCIDGSYLLHRNYHAYPNLKAKDGTPTGAIYGAFKMLKAFIEDYKPMKLVVLLDSHRKSFRMDIYPDYKGTRPPSDPELKSQFALFEELCALSDIQCEKMDNYEGDDLLGSYAYHLVNRNYSSYILTGDRDMFQLINDKIKVVYISPKEGYVLYDEDKVKERYKGLLPNQIPCLKGLQGDTSDNIPGVKGVGEKTAISLLNQYGNLEGIYENIESLKGKLKENLMRDKEIAFISRTLAMIQTDLDVMFDESRQNCLMNEQTKSFYSRLDIKEF